MPPRHYLELQTTYLAAFQASPHRCPTEITKSACPKPSSSSFTFPKPAPPPVSPPLSTQCCYPPKYPSWKQQSVILGSSYQHPITNRAFIEKSRRREYLFFLFGNLACVLSSLFDLIASCDYCICQEALKIFQMYWVLLAFWGQAYLLNSGVFSPRLAFTHWNKAVRNLV